MDIIINKQISFLEYLGETQNITDLIGYSYINLIYRIDSNNNYQLWSSSSNPEFNSFNQLEKNNHYLLISKNLNSNYILSEKTANPAPSNISQRIQIGTSDCDRAISEISSKVKKIYGSSDSGQNYVYWDKNNNPIFNSLLNFVSNTSYLFISEDSELPYSMCPNSTNTSSSTHYSNEVKIINNMSFGKIIKR